MWIHRHLYFNGGKSMNLFNEIERVTEQYKIDPRVYKLFLKLSDEERANFLKDLLKISEGQHDSN
jgi:hypothetical protein